MAAYDPVAEEQARKLVGGISFADSPLDAAAGADAVVLVTEWSEFMNLDWKLMAGAMGGNLVDRRAQRPGPCRRARGGPRL